MLVGLDCSTKVIGWAVLDKRRRLQAVGHVRRRQRESTWAFPWRAVGGITACLHGPTAPHKFALEVNAYPKMSESKDRQITATGIRSFQLCRWAEGRLLQALFVDDVMEIQASGEKKPKRRVRIELKYSEDIRRLGLKRLVEDEIDALAVADSAAAMLLVEGLK